MSDTKSAVLPGDQLAISEEYLPGPNTFDDGGLIRALSVGTASKDASRREVSVRASVPAKVLKVGDYVVGRVEVAQTSSAGVRIYYVNGKPNDNGFTGSVVTKTGRPERGSRPRGPPVKLGDLVRCRVHSLVNGIVHLSIVDDHSGVLYALCGNCGRPLLGAGSRVKCDECGSVEDRKLADDFGQTPIRP
jgi:exosome complex component CSL4